MVLLMLTVHLVATHHSMPTMVQCWLGLKVVGVVLDHEMRQSPQVVQLLTV
jgi:hypothetical protein